MASVQLLDNLYYGIHPTRVQPSYHVDHYIDLTEPGEMPEFAYPSDSTHKNFPIPDRKPPTMEQLTEIVDYINSLSGVVYIFCKGGHGRSGTVAAAVYGMRTGMQGKDALKHVHKEWRSQRNMLMLKPKVVKMGSPQTAAQKNVVVMFLAAPRDDSDINYILFYDSKDQYGPFTNFYKLKKPLVINGEEYMDTEQYYQVMKFRGPGATKRMIEYSQLIKEADGPTKSKMLGHQKKNLYYGKKWKLNKKTDHRLVNDLIDEYKDVRYREDWNVAGVAVMLNGLYHKFTQFPKLHKLLTNIPDNSYIIEHTTRDAIWADGGDGGTGEIGQNRLGKLLTALSFVLKHGDCAKMDARLKNRIKIRL